MRRLSLHTVIVLLAVIALSAAGCGDNPLKGPVSQATPAPAVTPAAQTTPVPAVTPAAPPSAAPSVPAPPPSIAPSAAVSNLQLTASTPTQIPPGGSVSLALAFNLEGQQPMTVETAIAWRASGGELKYGEFKNFNAAPGANAHRTLTLSVSESTQVGASFEVFGAIKTGGQTYLTQTPLMVTVTAAQANASPVGPAPQPTPVAEPTSTLPIARPTPSDTRGAQIRTALQDKGLKVLEAGYIPAKDGKPPVLGAIVEADFSEISSEAILRLAFGIWDVLFHNMAMDAPDAGATLLLAGEQWTKYTLYLAINVEEAANYLKSVQAAGSDEQKQKALQTLLQAIRFSVFDSERQEFVDQKDFMNKNFTR